MVVWQVTARDSQEVSAVNTKAEERLNPASCHKGTENLLPARLRCSLSVKQTVLNRSP